MFLSLFSLQRKDLCTMYEKFSRLIDRNDPNDPHDIVKFQEVVELTNLVNGPSFVLRKWNFYRLDFMFKQNKKFKKQLQRQWLHHIQQMASSLIHCCDNKHYKYYH